jgi:hypothetical protein
MRQRIDLAALYDKAIAQVGTARFDGVSPRAWAAECPFSLDELLHERPQGGLDVRLTAASAPRDV